MWASQCNIPTVMQHSVGCVSHGRAAFSFFPLSFIRQVLYFPNMKTWKLSHLFSVIFLTGHICIWSLLVTKIPGNLNLQSADMILAVSFLWSKIISFFLSGCIRSLMNESAFESKHSTHTQTQQTFHVFFDWTITFNQNYIKKKFQEHDI